MVSAARCNAGTISASRRLPVASDTSTEMPTDNTRGPAWATGTATETWLLSG
ncbi:hypothetical protein D3C78_1982490 [compost metagenome]